MNSVCSLDNISFAYADTPVISHASLDIFSQEFVALIGDNGAGKSTLMNLILGNLHPSKGEISLFGDPIIQCNHHQDIAYVSQNSVLGYRNFPTTIKELVNIHRSFLHVTTDVVDLLKMVQLEDHVNKGLSELSGGQLQRVGILLALLKNAKLILLDEPTSGIDKKFSKELYELLRNLTLQGKTVVLITHHLHELSAYVDRVVRLEKGQLTEVSAHLWKEEVDVCA
ncbi:metal ABC transporter ATP-binding protein [Fannyhessea vaginae]|uniref:metal ABC transporter ATP-binding protein n=1 Tax=Fannyhessea vaginae TaxID=82135 RepID=UPI0023F033BB|nr:ATP-binding cassette domain-containing protein [Fannyhessea vaginae]